jgi:hypothetical protein
MTLTGRDTVLVVGSTMRLTRLLVTDDIGNWFVKWPAYRWAQRNNPVPPAKLGPFGVDTSEQREWEPNWRDKLVMGLDCPFCVGTWLGFGVLAITELLPPRSPLGRLWRFVMAGLSLNYLTAHISSRLDAEDKDEG